jgi:uncharacterized coiled-coil protein SlyX
MPVDKNFLTFWGNFLLNVAEGQKQLEQMTTWMRHGFTGIDEINDMFRRVYGLEQSPPHAAVESGDDPWMTAMEAFQDSFAAYAEQWGWVPRRRYAELQAEYERLEKKSAEQQETIRQLRDLLETKGMGHVELFQRFQSLVQDQSRQFQELMSNIKRAMETQEPPNES